VSAQPAPVIVVTEPLNDRTLKYVAEHGELRRVAIADLPAHIAEADALIVRTYTQVDEALLAAAKRLKVVGRAGVALENVDLAACRRRGVQVVHTPAANTLAVVDYTIAMILLMNRRFWPMSGPTSAEQFHQVRKGTFGRFLAGTTLGVIGCGRIGSRVGRAAAGLGMTVLVNDIIPVELDYPAEIVDKPALYARSDIVTIHVPLTRLTRRLIRAETLRQFKPGAQFINSARGPCVDYADLAAAIRSGHIAAAAIDCHDPEPPPPDYPMFGLDNVILTPHVAARVPAAMEAMCDVVYDVVAVLEGRAPTYPAKEEDEG
jgi:phosphoglycerate dehydrogenase-like enzyme